MIRAIDAVLKTALDEVEQGSVFHALCVVSAARESLEHAALAAGMSVRDVAQGITAGESIARHARDTGRLKLVAEPRPGAPVPLPEPEATPEVVPAEPVAP